jgi:hypothetical protein
MQSVIQVATPNDVYRRRTAWLPTFSLPFTMMLEIVT